MSVRFNAQSDKIVDTQARVEHVHQQPDRLQLGLQMGLSLAYDIASGGHWNCHYTCSGFPGGLLDEWEGRQDITVPSREWLQQQTVDVKVAMTDNISFQYLAGHTFNDTRQYNDWDAGEFNFYIDYFLSELDLTSHEFQFTGGNDRFSWVGGVYTWDQQGRARNPAYSMADWVEANPPGAAGSYPTDAAQFSYVNQVLPNAACNMTPAQRGITSWAPHVAAGYVPPSALALNVNSLNGWPNPCGFISGFPGAADWVTALAGGARPPAGDRLTGDEIDGYAIFGEVNIGLGEKFDLTIGYRTHDQQADQYDFDVAAGVLAGVTAPKPPGPNLEFSQGNIYDGIRARNLAGAVIAPRHVAFDADTYRVAGKWQLTDDVMVYIGYTEGFNSGGLAAYSDSQGSISSQFDPETIENTEIGVRSDLAGGKLRLNATYFDTDWVDIQLLATVQRPRRRSRSSRS